MRVERESIKVWSETVKNLAQVVVFCFAGYWTYYTFAKKEFPALEPRLNRSSSLSWTSTDKTDECDAVFRVDLANSGTAAFDISKVQVQGWMFDRANQAGEFATYLELNEVQDQDKRFFEKTYPPKDALPGSSTFPFLGHYPPGHSFGHSFEWIIRRIPNKWVFFRTDFYMKGNPDTPTTYTGAWSKLCAVEEKQGTAAR